MNPEKQTKQGILVVSFGTSYEETRKKTIEAIEQAIAAAFPESRIYRAWTSKMIIRKLRKQDYIVDTVAEAMAHMLADGITDVIVQPTHVTNGIENDRMKEEILSYSDRFDSVRIGDPLLTSEEDTMQMIRIVKDEFAFLPSDTALVFMGHGSPHYASSIYAALDYTFKDLGCPNVFVGTVEGYPDVDAVLRCVARSGLKKVLLAPFMIVAGDHANNDLAGEEEDSWKNLFLKEGYTVDVRLKGLGEYEGVRALLISHVRSVSENS